MNPQAREFFCSKLLPQKTIPTEFRSDRLLCLIFRHDYNLDEMVDAFISSAIQQQNFTKTNHQMWACGSDFQYQNADHWYHS